MWPRMFWGKMEVTDSVMAKVLVAKTTTTLGCQWEISVNQSIISLVIPQVSNLQTCKSARIIRIHLPCCCLHNYRLRHCRGDCLMPNQHCNIPTPPSTRVQRQQRKSGLKINVTFRDLECYGFTPSATFQHTVASYALALPRLIGRWVSRRQPECWDNSTRCLDSATAQQSLSCCEDRHVRCYRPRS